MFQDLKYGLRVLRKNPTFTAVAVLTLALGIGANTAMFSVVMAVLARPLPYPESDRLVQAANSGYYPAGGLVTLQERSRTMDVAGYNPGLDLNLTGFGDALRLTGTAVSANLFGVLGVGAELGRTFKPGEDQPGQNHLVVLSHALWRDTFGSDGEIVGKVIALGGVNRQVVGVMGPGFKFPDARAQFWIPLNLDPRDATGYWAVGFMPLVGRLRAGATLGQAQQEIQTLTHSMVALFPYPMGRDWNVDATVVPLQEYQVRGVRPKLLVLQGAIGLVLLIACVNVASLLLARGAARKKEIVVRTALGAGRGRIVRQLLTESVMLALAGGAAGLALASGALSVLKLALGPGTVDLSRVHLGWQEGAFVVALSVVTGVGFGLAPAVSAWRGDLAAMIRAGGPRAAGQLRAGVRSALIGGEVALATVLTMGAGLLIKSLWKLTQVNPGFQPQHLLTLRVSPNSSLCRERAACIAFYHELLSRAHDLPGVYDVAAANTLPMSSDIPILSMVVQGHPYAPGEHVSPLFWAGTVTSSYFRVMKIPIIAGRAFNEGDGENSAAAVIVTAAMARRYWPGENPIGKSLRTDWEDRWRTVVGVAADVRQYDLAGRSPDYIRGAMYMPYAQSIGQNRQMPVAMTLIVRAGMDVAGVAAGIRDLLRNMNPNVPLSEIRTMESVVSESSEQPRSLAWLFACFAGAALALAAIGTYGVVAYATAQRRFEMAVRMALGATRGNIFGLVLGQSFRLVLAGMTVGIAASLALSRALTSFLYGTAATDLVTFVAVSGVLVVMAVIAGYLPARRATRVDPMMALRYE